MKAKSAKHKYRHTVFEIRAKIEIQNFSFGPLFWYFVATLTKYSKS